MRWLGIEEQTQRNRVLTLGLGAQLQEVETQAGTPENWDEKSKKR